MLELAVLLETKDMVYTMVKTFRIKHLKNLKYIFSNSKIKVNPRSFLEKKRIIHFTAELSLI